MKINNKIKEINYNKINEINTIRIKEMNNNKINEINNNKKEINNNKILKIKNELIENNNKTAKNNNKLKTNINNKINNNIKSFNIIKSNEVKQTIINKQVKKNDKENIVKNIIKNKIISISGVNSKIKIILILMIIKYCEKNKKILIINMDFLNINYIKNINIINNKDIKLIDGRKIIFEKNNFFKNIEKYKNEYDLIIINCSHECFYEFNKKLIEISNKNYFLIRQEEYEYTKSINLFRIYKNIWKIDENKIKILVNK